MNRLITGLIGGMPVDENTFTCLQNISYEVLEIILTHLGIDPMANGKYIISGCEVVGANITRGILFMDTQVVIFGGDIGNINSKIGVYKEETIGGYKNGDQNVLTEVKVAIVSPTGTPLSDFTRIPKVQDLVNQLTDWNDIPNKPAVVIDPANLGATPPEKTVLERIAKLERQNAVFIAGGGMVLWNRPANEIPTDWQEVVNWKGRMPVGVNDQLNTVGQFIDPEFAPFPNPADSNSLTVAGRTGGNKTHTITKNQLPAVSPGNVPIINQDLTNDGPTNGFGSNGRNYQPLPNLGNSEAMPILNPYRTVYFIEYIGN